MATFGQGINPQLGAIDYSPILRGSMAGAQMAAQGSQMIGQGLASLGEDAGKAVQKYYYNKDTKEMLGGVTKRIAGILDTDPYIANKLGLRRDPKTNTWDEKGIAVAVTNIGGGDVRKGVQMTNGFLSDRAAQQVQNSAFLGATAPGVIMPGREAAMYSALGGDNPMGFAQYMQGQALNAAKIAETNSQIKLNLANAIKAATPTSAKPPEGYEYNATGNLKAIQGGPADVTTAGTPAQIASAAARRAAVTQDLLIKKQEDATRLQNKKFLNAAEARKTELENTLGFVKKARALSAKNVGGPIGGRIGMFGEENQKLAGYLDTIKSNLRLNKMSELKALSPSGSTGFGQQSDREGAVMEQYLGTLSQYQPEQLTRENLDVIEKYINKQLRSYNPKEALIAPVSDEAILKEFGL